MPTQSSKPTLSMGRVVLTVNDLDRLSDFYQRAVGLHLLERADGVATLGAGGQVLLELREDRSARRRSPREAGLFHTAFLLPSRSDLARWTRHAVENRLRLDGASDHAVSEALYLTDPEGNGIEIYADRPRERWLHEDGMIVMTTEPLDLDDLIGAAGDRGWTGFPDGAVVGHVHLQVGELAKAESFYAGVLGLEVTCRYPGAVFYAADGYHHHLATNVWNSRGAAERVFPATGLAELEIRLDPERAARIDRSSPVLADPWGTPIALTLLG